MNHPYLRAYMAAVTVPTAFLLIALAVFTIARLVCHVPVPVERVIIFPMAIVPNLFGIWNMLYLKSHARTHLPLGIHGAILPFLLAPLGFMLAQALGVLVVTDQGLVYFGMLRVPYPSLVVIFSATVIIYYLVWKYLIGFLNRVVGFAAS